MSQFLSVVKSDKGHMKTAARFFTSLWRERPTPWVAIWGWMMLFGGSGVKSGRIFRHLGDPAVSAVRRGGF